MDKEPITVECCKVDENVDLQGDELSTLICDFDGKTSDANIVDGTVSCHVPKVLLNPAISSISSPNNSIL
jgi:hypothetical protein